MLGITNATVASWEAGRISPPVDCLFAICDDLGISVADIYGRDVVARRTPEPDPLTTEQQWLVDKYDMLIIYGKQNLTGYIKDLIGNPSNLNDTKNNGVRETPLEQIENIKKMM